MSSVNLNRRSRVDKEGMVSRSKKSLYPQPGDRESIGYLTRYAYRAFVRVLAVELAEHEIHTGQWSALRILWEEEGLSQVELAERMSVEKASLTKTLDGMEELDLIARVRNTQDRRKVNIFLTAKGRRLKGSLLPYVGKINRQATKGMSPADGEKLKMLLMKVIANLDC
jgi:DNA-binding MarR family transcriptional regulator